MLRSSELRWFYPEDIPCGSIEAAFRQVKAATGDDSTDDRSDFYLFTPGCVTLGAKVRPTGSGTAFETKERQAGGREVPGPGGSAGYVEEWVKVSGSIPGDGLLEKVKKDTWPDGCWVEVGKKRTQLKYQVEPPGRPTPIAVKTRAAEGATAEFTALSVAGRRWWSVALEAFSDTGRHEDNLLAVLAEIAAAWSGGPTFDTEHSCGYPEWLHRVLSGAAPSPAAHPPTP